MGPTTLEDKMKETNVIIHTFTMNGTAINIDQYSCVMLHIISAVNNPSKGPKNKVQDFFVSHGSCIPGKLSVPETMQIIHFIYT